MATKELEHAVSTGSLGPLKFNKKEIEKAVFSFGCQTLRKDFIQQETKTVLGKYHCVVPRSFNVLRKFPGVGRKIALVTLYEAYGKVKGIVVDSHLKNIFIGLCCVPKIVKLQISVPWKFKQNFLQRNEER